MLWLYSIVLKNKPKKRLAALCAANRFLGFDVCFNTIDDSYMAIPTLMRYRQGA